MLNHSIHSTLDPAAVCGLCPQPASASSASDAGVITPERYLAFNLTEEQLAQTEEELGLRFPTDYREAMKKSNGGELITGDMVWELYPIRDTSDRKRLSRTCNHIISETISCQDYGTFPNNALTIGSNGSGDQLVFLKGSEAYEDTVYIWYHETGEIRQLASSFSEI